MEATLYLFVDKEEPELLEMYKKQIEEHNTQMNNNPFPNSGFDLLLPVNTTIPYNNTESSFIDFKIKTEMTFKSTSNSPEYPSAFTVYPRSSLSKTSLMLSNHVGIIDSGYRGNIKGAFRCMNEKAPFVGEKFTRLVQICHPSLCKIHVVLVEKETDLSTTIRGSGGFGSTGK
jgi:dUTP pyrophosphatase